MPDFVGRRADGARVHLFAANKTTRVRDVRWGDLLSVLERTPDGWAKVKWGAFQPVIDHDKAKFDRVYHNGIAERTGVHLLGPSDAAKRYLTNIIVTDADMRAFYADPVVRGDKLYPKLMHTALSSGRVGEIRMLSTRHGTKQDGKTWVPGFAPSDGRSTVIEVLRPAPEGTTAQPKLRWFGSTIGSMADGDDLH